MKFMVRGFLAAFGLGLGVQILFGCPEGPYYYDPEQYTPEEYEFATTALGRFLYKYWAKNRLKFTGRDNLVIKCDSKCYEDQ